MLGYEWCGEAQYRAWADCVHPDNLAATEAILRRAWRRGTDYATDFRVLGGRNRALGRGTWAVRVRCAGQAIRSYGVMLNITERKRAEEVLQQRDFGA